MALNIYNTRPALKQALQGYRNQGKTIGFVATMGALHNGHISLIKQAQNQCDVVVCSIFVNPTQFNDPKDLEKYPRPIDADITRLEAAHCDVLFLPGVDEMYAANEQWHLNIGPLEQLLEGASRPGHYQGVTQIVSKLFDAIKPDKAFFGQKDYQQVLVIKRMVQLLQKPVELIMCPIEREADGLAMSSRNIHLNSAERQHALVLSRALLAVKNNFDDKSLAEMQQMGAQMICAEENVVLDYFTIADGETLLPASATSKTIVALVAAQVGKTRLIDNMIIR